MVISLPVSLSIISRMVSFTFSGSFAIGSINLRRRAILHFLFLWARNPPMIGYVITAGLFAALSTFQVVGGIEGLASWTGVVFLNFLEPLFIPDWFDSFKIDPEFDPVRHCRLKLFQVIAGIFFTFAAKVDIPLSCTSKHLAFLTIRQPLVRPASIALALFYWPISLSRKSFKPFRVFSCGNKPWARFTIKATYSSKLFARFSKVTAFFFHRNLFLIEWCLHVSSVCITNSVLSIVPP